MRKSRTLIKNTDLPKLWKLRDEHFMDVRVVMNLPSLVAIHVDEEFHDIMKRTFGNAHIEEEI